MEGTTEDLKLDVYLPPDRVAGDQISLILWVHGGGILVGDKESAKTFAYENGDKSFLTAPLPDYRLGWKKVETIHAIGDCNRSERGILSCPARSRERQFVTWFPMQESIPNRSRLDYYW